MGRFEDSHELARLLVVGVRAERNVINRTLERQFLTVHCDDLLGLRQNMLKNIKF